MYFHDGVDHHTRASMLIRRLIDGHDPKYGVGSMTCSIYDTAWVSMVAKTKDGHTRWLFPPSFQYLLDHQQHDGGWQHRSTDSDGILNTLAALLAICKHITQPCQMREGLEDLKQRKSRAVYFLETKFSDFSVESLAMNPGSPVRIAKLLQGLQRIGIEFSFDGKEVFLKAHGSKEPISERDSLYSDKSAKIKSSLEAHVGEVDFDRFAQQKVFGSIMASPASTAAYLMNCSIWDDEAEAYLSHIVSIGDGKTQGGVPTRFPTTVFEITSVLTTLLDSGFIYRDLGTKTLNNAAMFLDNCLQLGSGVTGFAPYVEPDADNTAKAISTLCLLGHTVSPQGLIIRHEAREYFKTYTQDRTPSFVTNCRVLKALLDLLPANSEQMPQVEKIVKFLCNYWWTTNGDIEDPSNTSANYPIMLMAGAFVRLLDLWECRYVPIPEDPAIKDKVIISLFQALTKVLQSQNQDGSWGDGGCETTAYAVISLSKLYSLSSAPRIKLQVAQAIETGRKFLVDNSRAFPEPDRVWKGKTESGNGAIYQAHILAALHAPLAQQQRGPAIETHFDIPLAKTTIQTKYYARQAWLVDVPEWLLQASIIESHLLLPQIRDVRYAVFPSDSLAPDQYFESIPFAWTVANNSNKLSIGTEFMYQMMIVSMLDRQLEDYMENMVGKAFAGCLFEVEDIIYGIFYELELEDQDRCFCDSHPDDSARFSTATTLSDVRSVLYRFISHVLNHPYVLMASFQDQSQLRSELLSFLLSRVSQLSGEQNAGSAVDKTAHPYTYAFLACLVGDQSSGKGVGLRRDFLKTPEQQYLAADLCRHMSIISFMSSNVEQQQQKIEVSPVSAKSRGSSFSAKYHRHAFSRSISSASTTSSVYDDSMSPVSSISSVSTSPTGSASGSFFTKAPVCQATHPSSFITQESMQISRILDHERRCLGLCLDGLLDAGIDQRTNNVLRLFVDASALSEQILRDPNIGTTCDNVTTPAKPAEASILNPPPVPPKRKRRSVSAARAAINVEPLVTQQETQKASEIHENQHRDAAPQVHKYQDVHHTPPKPTLDSQVPTPILMERDWSWSKQPSFPVRRSSRAGSEVSRIESIMSEIDGIKLDTNPKFNSNSFMQRRTACEGDAIWTQPKIPINTQKHLINCPPADTETIKLAKARLETQRRLKYDAQKKTATYLQRKAMAEVASVQTNAATARTQTKATEDSHKQEAKRRATYPPDTRGWVKAPPPLPMDSMDVQAKKLQRASKWGGPKWKAPF